MQANEAANWQEEGGSEVLASLWGLGWPVSMFSLAGSK